MNEMFERQTSLDEPLLAVTFDVDWAPDWCIARCAELCRKAQVPATFFATHDSPILSDLFTDPLFEVGIHPNFLEGSSHGESMREVLETCLEMVPRARSMRTHGLYQSTFLLSLVADEFKQIETDVSLYLPLHSGLHPIEHCFGRSQRRLVRLPFMWEDDTFADWPDWDWSGSAPECKGLSIFNFHPLWIGNNLATSEQYEAVKQCRGSSALFDLRENDVPNLTAGEAGAATFLGRLLSSFPEANFRTISDISSTYGGTVS